MESFWLRMQYILEMINKKIALVACVAEKQDFSCSAKDMYISKEFKFWMKYAFDWGANKTFILSGKDGLLDLEEKIEPYDFNLNLQPIEYRRLWAENVLSKLEQKTSFTRDHFLILSNHIYAKDLVRSFRHYDMPLNIQ